MISLVPEVGSLFNYFDVDFDESKVDLKISLKQHLKREGYCSRLDGRPYSGMCLQYYQHHLGEDLAKLVHALRCKYSHAHQRLQLALTLPLSDAKLDAINVKIKTLETKNRVWMKDPSKRALWQANLRKAATPKKREGLRQRAKLNWSDPVYRDKQTTPTRSQQRSENLKKLHTQESFRSKWQQGLTSPVRIEKIREHSRKRWAYAREFDQELYYRMTHSSINKHHLVSGRPATSLEHQLSNIILQLGYDFQFESSITFEGKTYRPDFYLPKLNLVLEAYGDYWHANPEHYNEDVEIFRGITAREIWERDELRKQFYVSNGIGFESFFPKQLNDTEYVKKQIKQHDKT